MGKSEKTKKRFFTNHAKSSAMIVSLALHAILIIVAISFVAVTVVQRNDKKFEAPHVLRPKMPVKKLQVPVKMKKRRPKPKIRKQITVKTRMDRKMPDIKMPEMVGLKGGLSAVGAGLGGVAGVGFSMPEIDVLGVKSKGEKVFIVLDSTDFIMYDELGGIPGYSMVKGELVRILDNLPSTTLFNIAVYDGDNVFTLFSNLVPANRSNVEKAGSWLEPLNAATGGKGQKFGIKTLGPGGKRVSEDFRVGKIDAQRYWYPAVAEGMKEQADTVFLLTSLWASQWHEDPAPKMSASARKKWKECAKKARKLYAEENKKRLAKGMEPRVVADTDWEMNLAYFPNIEFPQVGERYYFTIRDYQKAFETIRKKYNHRSADQKSGLRNRKKSKYTINVIQFGPGNASSDFLGKYQYRYDRSTPKFQALARKFSGEYKMINGMEDLRKLIEPKATK